MAKMNYWRAGKLYRKSSLDIRYENDVPDRAAKWLERAEERLRQQRHQAREPSCPSTVATTASSTAAVPW
jgi:hypothetical protein